MVEPIGRAKGGVARMKAMTKEKRVDQGKKAAMARWSGEIKRATHGSSDHPLCIGDINIPCYVLEGGMRVLSQRGLQTGIGMSISGGSFGEQRMAGFIEGIGQKGVDIKDLSSRIRNPIRFGLPEGGRSFGFEATILADICEVVLAARRAGVLLHQQMHIAERCEILIRGFARVGIIALVDEATGYQNDRARDALSKILEAFIAKELQPYVETFPADYYKYMFKLRGLDFPEGSVKRPQYFGILTNDIVYKRLAPNVLEELKRLKSENGRNREKLFQRLTSNIGYPKLREHLGSVVAIMKLSKNWHDFMDKLDQISPKYGATFKFVLEYDRREDDGKGI